MASSRFKGTGDIQNIAAIIRKELKERLTCETVKEVLHKSETNKVLVMVFEKYYFRANNRATLTVVLEEHDKEITVDVISSGGGQGMILKFDWGAENDFIKIVEKALRNASFI